MMNGMDLAMNNINSNTSEIKKAVYNTALLVVRIVESCKDFHLESYS